ncbi:hypothetical protein HAX54_025394 [Datura stramonium]|uniref:NB-ARC domain-containing protein n=1 Tax=Datura stramonium TaxID=4076 RepID=A0ABS8V1G3_DATST|nr:hypothetical protein [Datura stramonium]
MDLPVISRLTLASAERRPNSTTSARRSITEAADLWISHKRETYGITNINNAGEGPSNQSAMVRTLRRTTSYADRDHIFVGFQDVVERLLAELLKTEPRRSVISIYGMGGLGKTTLARNLYISPNIVSSFPTRSWICVSQEYNMMDLAKNIIKSIQGRTKENLDLLEKMTRDRSRNLQPDLLKERKYLVVADDVWQREAWESLKRAFPDSNNGSRVIITTRKEDIAERADNKGFIHRLRFLSPEEVRISFVGLANVGAMDLYQEEKEEWRMHEGFLNELGEATINGNKKADWGTFALMKLDCRSIKQSLLRVAEEKQSGDQRVQQWVFEINSVANDVVAILETYSLEASEGEGDGFASRLKAYACIYINNAGEGPSNPPNNQSAMVRTLGRTTSYVDEDHIFVGFQDVVERMLVELLKAEPRKRHLHLWNGRIRQDHSCQKPLH